ncbi:alkaline phosphatase family protein [Orrella marina]|uniref:Alkaline phosphatase family protein n=1 Tax=Orrella marina TaxID=2163011 RepID=A0A2R4XMD0_9BURK|nr:alkaline phosphatase family protein [Orrella marina]AWB34879.1 alkaline phosphatase family protein [Orrella marina]
MLKKRGVVVICDSLRNDFVGQQTPVLNNLQQTATRFTNTKAVFPSTTRVSSASIATGCHPRQHGLLGNTMILSEPEGLITRSVGKPAFRQELFEATGHYLRVPTLAQRLQPMYTTAIYSNVSPGAAYFFDPENFGYVYHPAGSYAPGGSQITGSDALDIKPGADGDQEMTRRFCQRLLQDDTLGLAVLWLSEPDKSGHAQSLGNLAHRAAIEHAQDCVDKVLSVISTLRARGEDILLMVGSDHGMQTITHQVDIGEELVKAGFKASVTSRDLVVAPNGTSAILGFDDDYPHRDALLPWLGSQPWVGEYVYGESLADWGLPDESACRVAISLAGDESCNHLGIPGTSWYAFDPDTPKDMIGQGQHGGRHRYESHPFLMVQGKAFPEGLQISTPTSLVDYAPTILNHLSIEVSAMQGQPLQTLARINIEPHSHFIAS